MQLKHEETTKIYKINGNGNTIANKIDLAVKVLKYSADILQLFQDLVSFCLIELLLMKNDSMILKIHHLGLKNISIVISTLARNNNAIYAVVFSNLDL